jgi:hypothetical protein
MSTSISAENRRRLAALAMHCICWYQQCLVDNAGRLITLPISQHQGVKPSNQQRTVIHLSRTPGDLITLQYITYTVASTHQELRARYTHKKAQNAR